MAEIEAALLEKVHMLEGAQEPGTLVGFLRPRKKRIGTLIEAKDGQSLKNLKREVKKKGGKKLKLYKEINTLYAEMPVEHVSELAAVACAQKVYDAEGDVKLTLNQSVPLVMGVEKWQLPYRFKHRKLEGQGVKVAVIDSGIDKKHPDFAWRIKKIKNFSGGRKYKGVEHGTHVAGIIGGSGKVSGYRYVGVAPKVTLYDVKVFINPETPTTRPIIIEAILWAVQKKVDIINMSFGDSQGCSDGTCILCKTANYAVKQGITVVTAAGNGGPSEGTISCPGNANEVITVGATTKTHPVVVASFSGRGSSRFPGKPDVVAPGDHIVAPQPGRQYTAMSGTSMAAPHVTGMATLLHQTARYVSKKSTLSPEEVKIFLKHGGHDIGECSAAQGNGLANFETGLALIQPSKKNPWFSKVPKTLPQIAPQPAAVQTATFDNVVLPRTTCPAVMHQFCPHYDETRCNGYYADCLHYQSAYQMSVLKIITDAQQSPDADVIMPNIHQGPDPGRVIATGTTWLSGKVTGTISGKPLSGVTVKIENQSATTDIDGHFRLQGIPRGIFTLRAEGAHVYPRGVVVNTAKTYRVKFDVIEDNPAFDLQFYRQLVRGYGENWPLRPLYRWTSRSAPTFYIDTNPTATMDGAIKRIWIKAVRKVIKQVLPVFSGGTYRRAKVKLRKFSGYEFDEVPDNSIVISFDDTLYNPPGTPWNFLGMTITTPLFTESVPGSIHKARIFLLSNDWFYRQLSMEFEQTVAHELGHAFGFRHVFLPPSIMKQGSGKGVGEVLFSERDKLHMKIVYSRPVGNRDVDDDPSPDRKGQELFPTKEMFVDPIEEEISLPPKLKKRFAKLEGQARKFARVMRET